MHKLLSELAAPEAEADGNTSVAITQTKPDQCT